MEVDVLDRTPSPDDLAATAARNDYYPAYVGSQSFPQVMDTVDPHDELADTHLDHLESLADEADADVPADLIDAAHDDLLGAPDLETKTDILATFCEQIDLSNLAQDHAVQRLEQDILDAKKRTLLTHLLNHGHYGPFEHPNITFAIKGVSRSCMAQLTRHRHASFDVQSMRYVNFEDIDPDEVSNGEWVVVPPSASDPDWVGRNQKSGQVTEEEAEEREAIFRKSVKRSFEDYRDLVQLGMPPEDARYVLPIGWRTNIVMTLNARHLMHVADMRAAADAQWEIRDLTNQILEAAEDWAPLTFDLYDEILRDRKNRLAP